MCESNPRVPENKHKEVWFPRQKLWSCTPTVFGLYPREDSGGGGGAVRDLLVHGVGLVKKKKEFQLDQSSVKLKLSPSHLCVRHVGQPFEGEVSALGGVHVAVELLRLVDPGRGDGGDAHAVAHEDHHVLGVIGPALGEGAQA